MRTTTAAATLIAGAVATAISLSARAEAGPNPGPCGFTLIPICLMIPVMPDLDHDVDLTQDPNGLNGRATGDLAPAASGSGG
jgi:hypothetical protein